MSKQLKLKFKKLLKKADFIHADLEYHEELVAEAKALFHEAVEAWIQKLPEDEQKKLKAIVAAKKPQGEKREEENRENEFEQEEEENQCTSLVELEKELEEDTDDVAPIINKDKELKRLFYRVAEKSHPDKAAARGVSAEEVKRLEKIFRRAAAAHKTGNWYVLYSIASELGVDLGAPTDEHLDWVEEDIRKALGGIARIAHLVVWAWYTGDDETKDAALRSYFLQAYNYLYPPN